jgi:hypothetical protein
MELQGKVGQVEVHFGLLGDSVNLGSDRCNVCAECTTVTKSFWLHSMDLQDDVGQMEAHFGLF